MYIFYKFDKEINLFQFVFMNFFNILSLFYCSCRFFYCSCRFLVLLVASCRFLTLISETGPTVFHKKEWPTWIQIPRSKKG